MNKQQKRQQQRMHNILSEKMESQSIFNQSEINESKFEQSHQCQYYNAIKKANKIINRKNRQIQTLNRIIKNLKTDIAEFSTTKQQNQTQLHSLKLELESAKKKLAELELKEIQTKRQICQQRLENAMRIAQNPGKSRIIKDISRDYFSQCQISRNTADERYYQVESQSRVNKLEQMFRDNNNARSSRTNPSNFNMGELFMGRKMKIETADKLNRHSSWGQFQLLNKPKRPMPDMYEKQYSFQGKPPYGGNMNFEDAVTFIKKQNQGLKSPIF